MMLVVQFVLALENTQLGLGILVALALAAALLVPYLLKEIRRGKVELGPRTPTGAGDIHPGRAGNPAPGQPDAQADPYDPKASR
jgi:hypothetical protein